MNETPKTKNANLQSRPPVVVILGHVDHGKTSILDYIRQTKVAEKESGGITQHIGAYQIEHQNKLITFIDTPGHEAFSAMRSRGAKVADIAILVVAADEGIKPQTKEAINHISRLGLPLIVAINKMDKSAALPDKVKKELAENNVLVESLGGQVPAVLVSAKTGLGINELLEMILLISDMEGFKTEPSKPASGIIIESRLDSQRGATVTLLVQSGTLKLKDAVAAESAYGTLKSIEDFLGQALQQAPPSTPALITGFNQVPPVGEEWQVMPSLEEAKTKAQAKAETEKRKREPAEILDVSPEQKVFNLILKADVSGSLEAIREALRSIDQSEIILRIIKAEVGDAAENDVKLADSAKAKIYGFRVKAKPAIAALAERYKIKVVLSPVIYELIQAIREDASRLLKPEIAHEKLGRLKVLAIFKAAGQRQVIGGKVTTGKLTKDTLFEVFREEESLGKGKVIQLQQNKQNAQEVIKDRECGLLVDSEVTIDKDDILEIYREEKVKREL